MDNQRAQKQEKIRLATVACTTSTGKQKNRKEGAY